MIQTQYQNKCCEETSCPQLTYQKLDEIIYLIKLRMAEYFDAYWSEEQYGYSCIDESFDKWKKLKIDLTALTQYKEQSYAGVEPCLCPEEVQTILERVLDEVGDCNDGIRTDLIIDDSDIIDWRVNNPYCIPREMWENALYVKCAPLTFNIEVIKDIKKNCEITFDLVAFLDAVKSCEIRYTVERIPFKDCEIEFKILREEVPECDITFDLYRKLRDCGIDYKFIKESADCGITFTFNEQTQCPEITYDLKTFPICDWPDQEAQATII